MALETTSQITDDEKMRECIENCLEATEVCEWCADECIALGDSDMIECIRLCRDVADVASLHARFMARNSQWEAELADLCASLCTACADECETHDHDHCQACVSVLRTCAQSCSDMAGN